MTRCPHCQQELVEGRDYRGKLGACPYCQKAVPPPMPAAGPTMAEAVEAIASEAIAEARDEAMASGILGTMIGFDYRKVELSGLEIAAEVLALVPAEIAREKRLLPLSLDGGVLQVVMATQPSPEMVDNLRFLLNHPIEVVLARREAITGAMRRYYPDAGDEEDGEEEPEVAAPARRRWVELESETAAFEKMVAPDGEVVQRMVQTILREAFALGASRVLILPFKNRVKLAYRIEEAIYARDDLAPELLYALVCTLMTMTNLSGQIKVSVGKQERQVQVNFRATQYGISAIMEIAQSTSASQLGLLRASRLGYPFVDLGAVEIPRSVLNLVPEKVARQYRTLPVAFDGEKLTLAMGSPRDPETLERLRFALNRMVVVALATEGAVVAAIERYYGSSDPETAEAVRKQLEAEAEPSVIPTAPATAVAMVANHPAARPFVEFLRTVYQPPMLQLFEELRTSAPLCQPDPATGTLKVVLPHAELIATIPAEGQKYIDAKIWVFREALATRLEVFLERDPLARGLAATYAMYLACCRLAAGQTASINPACMREEWLNCLYALMLRWFPALNTNGALARCLAERSEEISAKVAALLANSALVADPTLVRGWFARLERQMFADEPIGCHSPIIVHQLELLLAEAARSRASHLLVLPHEGSIEVAYRVQKSCYGRESLALELLLPMVARLRMMAHQDDTLEVTIDKRPRRARVRFQCTAWGLAARIDLESDRTAAAAFESEALISGFGTVDLTSLDIPARLMGTISKAAVWKKRILPVSLESKQLTVAMSSPPTPRQLTELKVLFRHTPTVVLAPEDALIAAIYRHYYPASAGPAPSEAAVALLEQAVREASRPGSAAATGNGEPGGPAAV